ncbi:glycosyltransferase [Pseudomonas hefeiensis]|uniref:Glycosyltransferase n=1 Tax=Pseudomonas hefeiensis TaxID=2738125 RepID=A0ABY9GAX3_9PSED|nr:MULTISPECIES: glycosyltransferase [unclassified Pseudomonas]WLH12764.1 glycosyltransferase [Pseudomonas sp. FP205]WLH95827.1 glycosyltransferase [Pseudomonas sp. FP53]WLI40103.1 glycosyltransferase [Pseudomonas sp. FP821]
MTRLLMECTYVYEHPRANSGIQRVVRNVIRELPARDAAHECIPVVMLQGKLYEVKSLAPLPSRGLDLVSLRVRLEQFANLFWLRHRTLERRRPFSQSRWARRVLYVGCRLFALGFLSIPIRVLDRLLKRQHVPARCVPLQHQAGDQLVLLDSSWHADFFPLAEQLKQDGVGIVSVIYDLIPLTHPQFCDAGLVKVFNHWFDWIARTADGYIAISSTIRDQVRLEMERRVGKQQVSERWFDYFHLGSELDLVDATSAIDSKLRSEAFGISLLEGAMYGKPMISSEIGTGTSYINIHNETGLVVPPSNPEAFREAMRTLWDNPVQAREMGIRAEERYRQLFTSEEMGRKWLQLYEEMLEQKALSYA